MIEGDGEGVYSAELNRVGGEFGKSEGLLHFSGGVLWWG